MAKANPMTRREIEQKIVALAWRDDASLAISAHAEDADHLYSLIPPKPEAKKKGSGELSDGRLEKVAGAVILLNAGATDFLPNPKIPSAGPMTAEIPNGWQL